MAIYDYDIAVIGAGPGGYETAIKAAQMGKKTCVVESSHMGGTCLNVGCIPTKALLHSADLLSGIKRANEFAIEGFEPDSAYINMKKLQVRKANIVKRLVNGIYTLLSANNVHIIEGEAAFADAHTLAVNDKKISAENIIIATGSEVFMPPFIPQEGINNILTSTTALEIEDIPKSIAVIGGGVIGVEFAYLFCKLGVSVTVIELMDHILPMVDREISGTLRKNMENSGVVFQLEAKVKKIENNSVIYEWNGKECRMEAEAILMAVGRKPNTDGLNAQGIGIEFEKEAIKTDGHMRTNIPNIYAIGDVNGKVMLAHTASHEGMVAVENICGTEATMPYDRIPSCIYTDPEIASIGLTEEQAKTGYPSIKVGRFPMMGNGKSIVEGEATGLIKVILEGEFGQILGVHIYCRHATEMIGEIAVAMTGELTAEEVMKAIHPHPTIHEALAEAVMSAWTGKAINSI